MARSTTPRSGTRRGGTTAKKAPPKRTAKATSPAASDAPAAVAATSPATATAPASPPAKKPVARKPAAVTTTRGTAATAPKAPAKAKAPGKRKVATAAAESADAASSKKAAKPKAASKPRAVAKPAETTRTAKAKAAVTGAAAAVAAKLPDVKVPKVKVPEVKLPELPEVTPKRAAIGAGLLAGIGAAVFLWRSSRTDQPDYTVVEQDGDFEVREYPATTTAAATSRGPRVETSDRNFGLLADYIYAKSRPGEKLSMTVPVTHSGSATEGWTTRFLMPTGKARGDLPPAPNGVTLESHPARRVGAVRFSGRWRDDALFEAKEGALRSWLQLKGYPSEAKGEHAAYNSPMMPGPLRRNEVLVTLSEG